jgi:lipoprotein-anchoring transpeptidase ErfK/SrfK
MRGSRGARKSYVGLAEVNARCMSFLRPGTNVYGDGPGSGAPTGSHGCVNIPFAQAQWLWNWAPVGTPVVVYGGPSVTPGVAGI